MFGKHVAFCLEQQYGHIVPTLGIALELAARGYKVSYAITKDFARLIQRVDAEPLIINPVMTREKVHAAVLQKSNCFDYKLGEAEFKATLDRYSNERTIGLRLQLEALFQSRRPDLIIRDDCFDTAGRDLADDWGISRIRHHSQFLDPDAPTDLERAFPEDALTLMTVPRFFQRNSAAESSRFRFVGFIPEGRNDVFDVWESGNAERRLILMSATTGLQPQTEFCAAAVDACRDKPWDAVLSISGSLDRISAIDPSGFGDIPANVQINYVAGNFSILPHSKLFIGQGGQGSTLEAIYWGVPQILVPPTPFHYSVARRVSELGLGTVVPMPELAKDRLSEEIEAVLSNRAMLERVREASHTMQQQQGARLAADIIGEYV